MNFKFNIGDIVECDMTHKGPNWRWVGVVVARNNCYGATLDGSNNEYAVTNGPEMAPGIPFLVWEEEMKYAPKAS